MHTYHFALEPDEHEDFVTGVVNVQVAEPEYTADGRPNPNRSPIYVPFVAGQYDLSINDEADWDTVVVLTGGRLSKRQVYESLQSAMGRQAEQANDPNVSRGGQLKTLASRDIIRPVSGTVLEELEELRAYKAAREKEEASALAAIAPENRRFVPDPEGVAITAAAVGETSEDLMAALRPGERKCPLCGKWVKNYLAHLRFTARNGKALKAEHAAAAEAYVPTSEAYRRRQRQREAAR